MFGVHDLHLARNEPFEKVNFFVVDIFQILGTEEALLAHKSSVKCQASSVKLFLTLDP